MGTQDETAHADEVARHDAVQALRLLGAPASQSVCEIVRLAAQVCGVDRAVVNIMDGGWVFAVGATAGDVAPVAREDSPCRHVIETGSEMVWDDAQLDPRLASSPYVDGRIDGIRFYASVPLRVAGGQVVGALCAFDHQVRHLGDPQLKLFRALAAQVIGMYELQRLMIDTADHAEQLAEAASWAAEVLSTSRDAYYAISTDGTVTEWNRAAEEMFGYARDEAVGSTLADLIVPVHLVDEFTEAIRAELAGEGPGDGVEHPRFNRRKDGSELTVAMTVWRSAAQAGWHAFARDITGIEAARRERWRAECLLTMAFDQAPHGTAIVGVTAGEQGVLLRVNPALARMLHRDDLTGASLTALVAEESEGDHLLLREFDELAHGDRESVGRVWRLRSGGGYIYAEATITLARDLDGHPEYALAQLRDVTQQRAYEDWLTRQAKQDPLTGLANRMAMRERLEDEIERLREGAGALAVLMLDLDHFKSVNDCLGHHRGDELLLQVAQALVEVVPADALVVRLGGDEFVVIAAPVTVPEAEALAARVVDAVADAAAAVSQEVPEPVACSLGLVTTENPATAPQDLVRAADEAMYRAKRRRHDVVPSSS